MLRHLRGAMDFCSQLVCDSTARDIIPRIHPQPGLRNDSMKVATIAAMTTAGPMAPPTLLTPADNANDVL
eukprot:6641145-Pyramimonas_sp.AAC.1